MKISFSNLQVELGVEGAVNMDGGGSSASVLRGKVVDLPTSTDVYPEIVQREVANIACVRN
jgi:exopolysaccharide biosynthesis protein